MSGAPICAQCGQVCLTYDTEDCFVCGARDWQDLEPYEVVIRRARWWNHRRTTDIPADGPPRTRDT